MVCKNLLWSALVIAGAYASIAHAKEIEVGAKAPDFKVKGVDGKDYSLADTKGAKATVLCFTCNGCPVAVAYENRFIEFTRAYSGKGVKFIAINCNNASEDLKAMKKRAEDKKFNFPYAFDASGDSARAYGARVTPHLFVLDQHGKIAYRGSFDDKMTDSSKPYVANAVDALLAGKTPETNSTSAFGCGIKLK